MVEDMAVAQFSQQSVLEHLGHEVTIASTGQEAIEAVRQQDFQLIFLDIGLPDLDVLTVMEAIQTHYSSQNKKMPALFALTGHGTEHIKQQCLNTGMNEFLHKPLTLTSAKEVISKYFHGCAQSA